MFAAPGQKAGDARSNRRARATAAPQWPRRAAARAHQSEINAPPPARIGQKLEPRSAFVENETMAAADDKDKKKKQKTTESLDDAVKQLGLSKRAIHEVVRVATARAAELSGQRVGMDLLHALTRE